MAIWNIMDNDANIPLMAETLKVTPLTAHILANRGIRTKNNAIKYLSPSTSFFYSAELMKEFSEACEVIALSILRGEKIFIYGDYDVDGVMSTVILFKALKNAGAENLEYYIPNREEEGYGLNCSAVNYLKSQGADLIISCDNGIASVQEIALAKSLGMKVVVIDHHEPIEENGKQVLPEADAIVNPKQLGCEYPFKSLCAAGVCFKFVLQYYLRHSLELTNYNELLIFAMIATFCDVVDLMDENRIIAKVGLHLINNNEIDNKGLASLIQSRSLDGKKIGSFDVGFIIGPCINATGRLESANISADLFLSYDETVIKENTEKLVSLNEERKKLTTEAVEKLYSDFLNSDYVNDKILVLFDPEIHESIAGIVAGRVKEMTNKPVIVLTSAKDDGIAKGSARSIECYDIYENLSKYRDLYERFGGHSMAAGLSLKAENIDVLRKRLNEDCEIDDEDFDKVIDIDKVIELDDVTFETATELLTLEPFGKSNEAPLFMAECVVTETVEIIGSNKKTLKMSFRTEKGRLINAIAFNKVDEFFDILSEKYSEILIEKIKTGKQKEFMFSLDIVFSIDINEYNGNKYLQMRIVDFALAE